MHIISLTRWMNCRLVLIFAASLTIIAQLDQPELETSRFEDGAHHWYDIFDEDRVINPLENQPKYKKNEIEKIGDNILLFQKANGGWAKNFDMQAILNKEQIKALKDDRNTLNTTFDNGATHSQLTYLAEVYSLTKKEKYKEGFLKGIEFVFAAQYENGGWPQFYPDTTGYRKYITFNDNAMVGVMNLLQRIVQNDPVYDFVDIQIRDKIKTAYEKGIDAILNCQIIDNGIKTVWCQQHDNVDFKPQDARIYEKPSICNGESVEIVKLLLREKNPDEKIIEAVETAINWFRESEIYGIRVDRIKAEEEEFIYHRANYDRVVIEDSTAPRIWARFYELGTHKPIFVGRDGIIKYSMKEIDRDRRTGYGWYTYAPEEIYQLHKEWEKDIKN